MKSLFLPLQLSILLVRYSSCSSSQASIHAPPVDDIQQDFFSKPKFRISFASEPAVKSRLIHELEQQGTTTGKFEIMKFKSPLNEEYFCQVPQVEAADDLSNIENSDEDPDQILNRAFKALEPYKNHCLTMALGYWTYDFCHMSHVKQYHPPPSTEYEYVLGRFEDEELTMKKAQISKGKHSRVVSISLDDGTFCDLTGRPRRIQARYYCSSIQPEISRIEKLEETSTCVYSINIHIYELCKVPYFVQTDKIVNIINCTKVMEEVDYEKYLVDRKLKQEQTKNIPQIVMNEGKKDKDETVKALSMMLFQSLFDKRDDVTVVIQDDLEDQQEQQQQQQEEEEDEVETLEFEF